MSWVGNIDAIVSNVHLGGRYSRLYCNTGGNRVLWVPKKRPLSNVLLGGRLYYNAGGSMKQASNRARRVAKMMCILVGGS